MRALTGETMLAAWERGLETSPQRAALAVLAFAEPERSLGEWAWTPLGERNATLLELRAASLGRRLDGFATCPECGAEFEFALDAVELARGLRARVEAPTEAVAGRRLRPANTLDLLAAGAAGDEIEARNILLARALCRGDAETGEIDAAEVEPWLRQQPTEVVDDLSHAFDTVNASAEIRARFHCAACGEDVAVDIDAARFLIEDISCAARRLLGDIHDLASAYGWSEQSIVAMSAARRSAYLELLRG